MTILQFLDITAAYFAKNSVDSPRLTAELLLAGVLKKKRMQLYLEFSAEVTDNVLDILRPLVKRRAQGEPLQYVQGFAEFHGARYLVNTDVLIPRPETELLFGAVLSRIDVAGGLPIADVGTGSGILAVSLAKAHPDLQIHAVDISVAALEVARKNAENLTNVQFYAGHLMEPVADTSFQLIVANLPYIPRATIPHLSREVRREPILALDGGQTGVELIQELIKASMGRTRILGLEIGSGQADEVKKLLLEHNYDVAQVVEDFCHVERIIVGSYCG